MSLEKGISKISDVKDAHATDKSIKKVEPEKQEETVPSVKTSNKATKRDQFIKQSKDISYKDLKKAPESDSFSSY